MKKVEESEVHANVTGPAVVGTGDDKTGMTWRKRFRDFYKLLKRKELEDMEKVARVSSRSK